MTRVAAGAAVLALAACGGRSGASDASDGDPQTTELPGIKEFGLTEEEFTQHIERSQALIAECMANAGFEYIPVDVKTIEAAQDRVRQDPGLTRKTFKQKWGLAVTTRFDNPPRDVGMGPNLEIYNGLPESDRAAYARTLWGDTSNHDFVFAMDEEDFSRTGGCTREAVAKVFTPVQLKGSYANPKDVLVEQDPRIIEATRKWSECMHEHGYEYEEDQDEIIEEYQERLEELTEGDDPQSLTGARAQALKKLQQEEIEVSLADYDCQVRFTDDVYREVELEVFGEAVSG